MHDEPHPDILVVSNSTDLLAMMRTGLDDAGVQLRIAGSAEEALWAMLVPPEPCLVLVDAELPGLPIQQALAGLRAAAEDRRFPIILFSDCGIPEWKDRLAEGVIDDLFSRSMPPFQWRVRIEIALRAFRHQRELEQLRETSALNHETDPVTGLYKRAALLAMLFRETDRVQRMKTPLSLMLFDIDDFAHWSARLGAAAFDEVLKQVVGRVRRLLRSYDLFARTGFAAFVLALPGCSPVNAASLADRIRYEVFSAPFASNAVEVRLTASFGIACSRGRSPVVVLREAEQALFAANAAGPKTTRSLRDFPASSPAPANFLSKVAVRDRLTR